MFCRYLAINQSIGQIQSFLPDGGATEQGINSSIQTKHKPKTVELVVFQETSDDQSH